MADVARVVGEWAAFAECRVYRGESGGGVEDACFVPIPAAAAAAATTTTTTTTNATAVGIAAASR